MNATGRKPLELDGHPEPSGKIDLLSHGNTNGAVGPGRARLMQTAKA
jgi:hypothetical protein